MRAACDFTSRLALCGAAALAFCACSDLQPIQANTCGNGVVEENEDCDQFAVLGEGTQCGAPQGPGPQRCRYTCTADGATPCPDGWACDRSGVCQFASGEFTEAQGSPFGLVSESLELRDIDGDRSLDLVGANASDVRIRFGAGNGQFPDGFDQTTPTQESPPSLGDLDGDQASDAVVPIASGLIVVRGQASRTVIPVAALADVGELTQGGFRSAELLVPEGMPGVRETRRVFLAEGMGTFEVRAPGGIVRLDPPSPVRTIPNLKTVEHAQLAGPEVAIGIGDVIALAFEGDDRVFVIRMEGEPLNPGVALVAAIAVPAGSAVANGVHWADTDGDGDLDLLISVQTTQEDVAVAINQGSGAFAGAVIDPRFDTLRQDCVDEAQMGMGDIGPCTRFPAGAGDLGADPRADFIAANGVYLTGPGGALIKVSDRMSADPWTDAVVADFNGDLVPDLAAVSNLDTGVDILIGNGSGVFTHARIGTDGAPTSLAIGDFDGDFLADLAFAETLDEQAFASVVFGEPFGVPDARVVMGVFDEIIDVEAGRAAFPRDLSDELVIDTSDPDEAVISEFFGTPGRQMVSPISLDQARPFAAEFGDFDGDGVADIAAVTGPPNAARVWVLRGPIDGEAPDPDDAIPLADAVPADQFDFGCSRFFAGNIDDDAADELLAVDGLADCRGANQTGNPPPRLLVIDFAPDLSLAATADQLAPGFTGVREVHLADLEGDGSLELIVAYGGQIRMSGCATSGDAGVVVYRDPAGNLADFTAVEGLPSDEIPSVAALDADEDPALELVIWTASEMLLAELGESGAVSLAEAELDTSIECNAQVLAGDVDGDGLADVAITDGARVEIHLAVSHIAAGADDR